MSARILLLVSSISLVGCGGYARSAVRVAALDHGCDQERVTLIEQDGTTAVVEVCGRRRVYRDTAGANNPATWTDVTLTLEDAQCPEPEPTPEPVAAEPEQPSVLQVEPAPAPTETPAPVEPAAEPAPAPAPEAEPAPAPAEEPAPVPSRRPRRTR